MPPLQAFGLDAEPVGDLGVGESGRAQVADVVAGSAAVAVPAFPRVRPGFGVVDAVRAGAVVPRERGSPLEPFRTLAGVNLYNQTDEAEAIDSALVKRAEIEALNVADRQIDLAWLAEGDKINAQMERLQRNIDRIPLAGGTTDDRERWTEYYHVYQCAIDATKDAYMPNAQRKKEYLRIYEDVVRQNEILVGYLARRQNATVANGLLNATADRRLDKGGIVREAMGRWNESRSAVRGAQSGGETDTGDGDETVNRKN